MSIIYYNSKNKPYAQKLRREATPQENHLWYDFLRDYPVQFRRQKQFDNYIVDFYCAKAKLVIEIDGSQHFEPEAMEYDAARTECLNELGLQVIRFTNDDINRNFIGVCQMIDEIIKEKLKDGKTNFR